MEQPPVSRIISMLDNGFADAALTADFAALVEEVTHRGKPGSMTVKLTVIPQGINHQQALISIENKVTMPKPPLTGSVLYVGPNGSLHRSDPYQQTLPNTTTTSEEIS